MIKVLVSGANGFLASNIIEELIRRKYFVRGMIRENADLLSLKGLDCDIFTGEINEKKDVFQAAKNMDYVIHVAANTSTVRSDYHAILKTNYLATSYFIDACIKYNIKRLIFISTANTIASGIENYTDIENNPVSPLFYQSFYARSKLMAENLIIKKVRHGKLNAIILNPTFMLGPRDSKPSSGKLIKMYLNKKIAFVPSGGKNFVYVKDVAVAVCNSLEMGKSGERYLLGNKNMSYKQFVKTLAKQYKQQKIIITLPDIFLKIIGICGDLVKMTGTKSSIDSFNMRLLRIKNFYNIKKAREQLLLPDTSVETAISDAVKWFKSRNL